MSLADYVIKMRQSVIKLMRVLTINKTKRLDIQPIEQHSV